MVVGAFGIDAPLRTDDEVVRDGIHAGAIEVVAIQIEEETRFALTRFGIDALTVAEFFDQARFEARLDDLRAPAFEIRLRGALAVRRCLKRWLAASLDCESGQ